jgi:amphi-Trp domain-containing protein
MSDFEHKQEERLSRRQAAERLIDIAYALTAGGSLELDVAGRRIMVPVANELRLERELNSEGDRVELQLELTWTIPEGASAAKRSRCH